MGTSGSGEPTAAIFMVEHYSHCHENLRSLIFVDHPCKIQGFLIVELMHICLPKKQQERKDLAIDSVIMSKYVREA
jgi:hypothetical protein